MANMSGINPNIGSGINFITSSEKFIPLKKMGSRVGVGLGLVPLNINSNNSSSCSSSSSSSSIFPQLPPPAQQELTFARVKNAVAPPSGKIKEAQSIKNSTPRRTIKELVKKIEFDLPFLKIPLEHRLKFRLDQPNALGYKYTLSEDGDIYTQDGRCITSLGDESEVWNDVESCREITHLFTLKGITTSDNNSDDWKSSPLEGEELIKCVTYSQRIAPFIFQSIRQLAKVTLKHCDVMQVFCNSQPGGNHSVSIDIVQQDRQGNEISFPSINNQLNDHQTRIEEFIKLAENKLDAVLRNKGAGELSLQIILRRNKENLEKAERNKLLSSLFANSGNGVSNLFKKQTKALRKDKVKYEKWILEGALKTENRKKAKSLWKAFKVACFAALTLAALGATMALFDEGIGWGILGGAFICAIIAKKVLDRANKLDSPADTIIISRISQGLLSRPFDISHESMGSKECLETLRGFAEFNPKYLPPSHSQTDLTPIFDFLKGVKIKVLDVPAHVKLWLMRFDEKQYDQIPQPILSIWSRIINTHSNSNSFENSKSNANEEALVNIEWTNPYNEKTIAIRQIPQKIRRVAENPIYTKMERALRWFIPKFFCFDRMWCSPDYFLGLGGLGSCCSSEEEETSIKNYSMQLYKNFVFDQLIAFATPKANLDKAQNELETAQENLSKAQKNSVLIEKARNELEKAQENLTKAKRELEKAQTFLQRWFDKKDKRYQPFGMISQYNSANEALNGQADTDEDPKKPSRTYPRTFEDCQRKTSTEEEIGTIFRSYLDKPPVANPRWKTEPLKRNPYNTDYTAEQEEETQAFWIAHHKENSNRYEMQALIPKNKAPKTEFIPSKKGNNVNASMSSIVGGALGKSDANIRASSINVSFQSPPSNNNRASSLTSSPNRTLTGSLEHVVLDISLPNEVTNQ